MNKGQKNICFACIELTGIPGLYPKDPPEAPQPDQPVVSQLSKLRL